MKKRWPIGVATALVFLVVRCGNDSSQPEPVQASPTTSGLTASPTSSAAPPTATSTVSAAASNTAPVGVAIVTGYTEWSMRAEVTLDYGGSGPDETFVLAHISGFSDCKNSYPTNTFSTRMHEIAPIGSTVTFVRGAQTTGAGTNRFPDSGFMFLAAPGHYATLEPFGPSVNEMLLAEGLGKISNPLVDLSALAKDPVEVQINKPGFVPDAPPNSKYWPKMLDAYRMAWNTRAGLLAQCRKLDDEDLAIKEQSDERWRIVMGPDGTLGTDDDGNPFKDSGGGGFGGCRGTRWC